MLVTVEGIPALEAAIETARFIGLDTETYGPVTVWATKKKDRTFVEALHALPACITLSISGENYYIPVDSLGAPALGRDKIESILVAIRAKPVVIHNAMYDIRVIENYLGYKWRPRILFDTMILSWLTDMGAPQRTGKKSHGLKELAKYHFGYTMGHFEDIAWQEDQLDLFSDSKKKKKGRVRPSNLIPWQDLIAYAEEDAYYSVRLLEIMLPKIKAIGYLEQYANLELPFLYTLMDMQYAGIQFDSRVIHSVHEACQQEVDALVQEWDRKAGCSISSTKKIIDTVYRKLKAWPEELAPKTGGGQPACSVKALDAIYPLIPDGLGRELIDIKRKHSKASKILTTYTTSLTEQLKYREDGRIRSNFFQAGTDTGRLSSRGPNLQNQPAPRPGALPIRQAFIARPGYSLISADYGALEVRIMCHWSQDPMLTAFLLEGRDMHQYVADQIKKPRSAAKAAFFAWCYGGREGTVASNLRLPIDEAKALIDGLDQIYEGVTLWRAAIAKECYDNGYVTTLLGRRRYLPDIYAVDQYEKNPQSFHKLARRLLANDPRMKAKIEKKGFAPESTRALDFAARSIAMRRKLGAERQAANTPIQGSAADIAKTSGIQLASGIESAGYDMTIILQVHDEWCFECQDALLPEAEPFIKNTMESCVNLRIPLIVSVGHGKNLYECK